MTSPELLFQNGWRQGRLLRVEDHPKFPEAATTGLDGASRLIVISQDCDLVTAPFSSEPQAEVIIAVPVNGEPDGNYTRGKNPRRLHLACHARTGNMYYECSGTRRIFINRATLAGLTPDPDILLKEGDLKVLQQWLVGRYKRIALPNEFNKRFSRAGEVIKDALKKHGEHIETIYIGIPRWEELPAGETYPVAIILALRPEHFTNTDIVRKARLVSNKIEKAFEDCNGLKLESVEVKSLAQISLEDVRYLRQLDVYDYLSY